MRLALAKPGNRLQRIALTTASIASVLLPLAAISWAGWQLFDGYYTSHLSDRPYLGTNFAIHSTLLIVIAWLLPWSLRRALRPSTEKTALKGLSTGVAAGLELIDERVEAALEETLRQRQAHLDAGHALLEKCQPPTLTHGSEESAILAQMVLKK